MSTQRLLLGSNTPSAEESDKYQLAECANRINKKPTVHDQIVIKTVKAVKIEERENVCSWQYCTRQP